MKEILEEKKLENRNEKIQENGMLLLLAVSPIVIGFFYYVMVQLPVIGVVWMYAAPFTVLYYWGWVATIFRSRFKGLIKTMVWMNGLGILTFFIYLWQYVLIREGEQIAILAVFSQLYTAPLDFITVWVGVLIDGSDSIHAETMSAAASVVTELVSVLLMIGAAVIGYFVGENQEKKRMEDGNSIEEAKKTEMAESVFSDRPMEDYELKDAKEAQKQKV